MAKSRLIGDYPVIGIRPTIDGRRGVLKVRESLEEQTMNMAKSAAKLFEENLRYTNGEPVKVVIADTTIGRVAESAACADKFKKEGVDITLTVTPCWCYGAETMDMDPMTIKAVWGFNGTGRPGAVYLASVLATHAQKGLPAFGIYGHDVCEADDTEIPEDVKEVVKNFRSIVNETSGLLTGYLKNARLSLGGEDKLLVILPDELSADFVRQEQHKQELTELIENRIGKAITIEVRQVEEGRRFEESFVDIEQVVHMDITIED